MEALYTPPLPRPWQLPSSSAGNRRLGISLSGRFSFAECGLPSPLAMTHWSASFSLRSSTLSLLTALLLACGGSVTDGSQATAGRGGGAGSSGQAGAAGTGGASGAA
ncbi:MAG: hypothetical protein EOO75_02100, partial [Myxococcales bacterium]